MYFWCMICFPNAKINIGLNIIEKRADGFHNLESVFYPICWSDALEAVPSKEFQFASSGLIIPGDSDNNLIVKAYALIDSLRAEKSPISIHLHKVIPMGAGLGGGSADGAFALKLFNELLELGLSNRDLKNIAAQLGSDCPFFIDNKPVLAYDRGIFFKEIKLNLSGFYIVCVNPGVHISTTEAYNSILPKRPSEQLEELIKLPVEDWEGKVVNDFEKPMLMKYPVLNEVKKRMYATGASYVSMTGSGSTFYGIFRNEPQIKNQFEGMTVWEGRL
jgi:4-diphosphocytidyl-2-C-methyl-D-erythritol kinase